MIRAKSNEHLIIKLQAKARGFLLRKYNKQANDLVDAVPKSSYRGNSNRPGRFRMVYEKGRPIMNGVEFAKELKEMPDYSNTFTKQVQAKLLPFQFDQSESPRDSPLIDRGPIEMDNGCVYHGQWDNENLREGKGTLIW